ncbi:FxSxx-COOH cyclophane-containing RiPP peptide [Streptomyces sp. NPDC049881]|uniref:FxSxx-COOH cyclophane-containing RiPP peptide n=1 Tax=unclassified Streptomyces TaxID=2593676 RepID=UPI003427B230
MTTRPQDTANGTAAGDGEPLPDLLALSLTELRRLDHPVLSEVLHDLRERVLREREGLWGFNQFSSFNQSMLNA